MPQQSNAGQALLDAMHDFYESLQANEMRLFRAFAESDLKFEYEYSTSHFYRARGTRYDGACFPLPSFSVADVCDVFVNDGSIDIYATLPELPSEHMMKRFHICEVILVNVNGFYLFRMNSFEDEELLVEFVKELKNFLSEYDEEETDNEEVR